MQKVLSNQSGKWPIASEKLEKQFARADFFTADLDNWLIIFIM